MRNIFLILTLFVLSTNFSTAQDYLENIKNTSWGEVSDFEKNLKACPYEKEAPAVVLCDFNNMEFQNINAVQFNYKIVHKIHRRIKILDQAGLEEANIRIRQHKKYSRVRRIQAQTININEDGSITTHLLDEDDFFEEQLSPEVRLKSFSFEKVQIGSILEYKYELETFDQLLSPRTHYFQENIPTLWSEVKFNFPRSFGYSFISSGKLYKNDSKPAYLNIDGRRNQTVEYRWAQKEMPSITEEAFITTMEDYIHKMDFQLNSYNITGQFEEVFSTWENLAKELSDHNNFGKQLAKVNHRKPLKLLTPILESDKSTAEKVEAVFKFVTSNIKWNGEYSITTTSTLNEVFRVKEGSTCDINLLLTALLSHIDGVTAKPMLISTRGHGKPMKSYPLIYQFNNVIAYTTIGDEVVLLDAVRGWKPMDLINVENINKQGLVIQSQNKAEWKDIPTPMSRKVDKVVATLNDNGNISGKITAHKESYFGMDSRAEFYTNGEEKYVAENYTSKMPSMSIDLIDHLKFDEIDEPLVENVSFTIEGEESDMIYFNPLLCFGISENPLKLKERKFPVEMPYNYIHQYYMEFNIPDTYEVVELPENGLIKLEANDCKYRYAIQQTDNQITLIINTTFNKAYFEPTEYKSLKKVYDLMVEKSNDVIILKKKAN